MSYRSLRKGIRTRLRYGLVQCKCHQFFIVEFGQRTKRCPRCGKVMSLSALRVLVTSDEQADLRRAIVRYAERLDK